MRFDSLDRKMRAYELSIDQVVTPDVFIVARLDGRGFTKLTKETLPLDRPFDLRFRDAMIKTVNHLMDCGFKITYSYTESDEISLLFDLNENGFARKTRKIISILAGEASARFTLAMNSLGVFDCRIVPLPNENCVIDYFRWRCEDAHRNGLNTWCYWKLRDEGKSAKEVTSRLSGMSVADKNELLFCNGINYNNIPAWQKRGIGFYYQKDYKKAFNPLRNEEIVSERRVLKCDMELPIDQQYSVLLREIIKKQ